MNVAEYIARFLVKQKVRHVFGLQGGAIVKLVDCMVATGKIDYVQNFHEQASAFCADAYSRVSGNLGVALATSGPGATNLITGIANAQLDSIPTLFLTGQEYSSRLKKKEGVRSNGFQDLDIVSVVKPIVKYAALVTDGERIAYELEKAVHIAKSGRPGAVLLDIPIDVQFHEIKTDTLKHYQPDEPPLSATHGDIDKFITLLKKTKRPVILAGGGVRIANARSELRAFAKATGIPVALTLNGLDGFDNAIGFSGLYGNTATCLAVYNADVLIVLGARLGQHQVGKSKDTYTQAQIVHVDIDALELERCLPEALSIEADLKLFLKNITNALKHAKLPPHKTWHKTISTWQKTYSQKPGKHTLASPVEVIEKAQDYFDDETIIASDVGQNQMWLAQSLKLRGEQRLLNSSGLGSMGYSLPAAIAAKLCCPNRNVVAFMGDGGFQINMQEMQLIALKKLDIKIFIFNNGTLGLIKSTQDRYFKDRYYGCAAPDFACVDLKTLSAAYKLKYYRVKTPADMKLLKRALTSKGPCIVEVVIDPNYPLMTRNDMLSIFAKERIND